ncbi:MAG: hypothetical protein LDL41_01945 [Coleofasciculus sp. S288]|nr:hypothetical protein [Coleofasciculus sp. S288]
MPHSSLRTFGMLHISEHNLIVVQLNFTPDRWDYELRHQVLEQFLTIPGGLEFTIRGLKEIFGSASKEDTVANHDLKAKTIAGNQAQ